MYPTETSQHVLCSLVFLASQKQVDPEANAGDPLQLHLGKGHTHNEHWTGATLSMHHRGEDLHELLLCDFSHFWSTRARTQHIYIYTYVRVYIYRWNCIIEACLIIDSSSYFPMDSWIANIIQHFARQQSVRGATAAQRRLSGLYVSFHSLRVQFYLKWVEDR